jgi:hypothetical protein
MHAQVVRVALFGMLRAAAPRAAAAQEIGILGGMTFSDITSDDASPNLDRDTGFLAGGFFRLPLGEVITFQPEVQWVRKGAEGELQDGSGGDSSVRFNYVDVPVFLSAGFSAFHVLAGPTFSFEVGCNIDVDEGGTEELIDCDDVGDPERKSFVAGVTVGGGLDLPIGGITLIIDGRYNKDLESYSKDDDVKVKNEVYEIVAGLSFPIGG